MYLNHTPYVWKHLQFHNGGWENDAFWLNSNYWLVMKLHLKLGIVDITRIKYSISWFNLSKWKTAQISENAHHPRKFWLTSDKQTAQHGNCSSCNTAWTRCWCFSTSVETHDAIYWSQCGIQPKILWQAPPVGT